MLPTDQLEDSGCQEAVLRKDEPSPPINGNSTEISVRGKPLRVPSVQIGDRTVIVTGKWIRMASVYEEESLETEAVKNPAAFVKGIHSAIAVGDSGRVSVIKTTPELGQPRRDA